MRSQFVIGVVVALSLTTGCKRTTVEAKSYDFKVPRTPSPRVPDFKFPDTSILDAFMVCDKVAENVPIELQKSAISVEGTSDIQDMEFEYCSGEKNLLRKVSKGFRQVLTIQPAEPLKDKVAYVQIENTRTCTSRQVHLSPSSRPVSFESAVWWSSPYWIGESGVLVIGLNESTLKFSNGLNVKNGQNLMKLTYYSRCLEKSDEKDSQTCKKGEEIGSQTVLVNATIEKRELNGIAVVKVPCDKNKPAEEKKP